MKIRVVLLVFLSFLIFSFYTGGIGEIYFPKHFPKPEYSFNSNPINSKAVALGRMLFYDPILSKNNSISCASCHSPYNSFAHSDHALSHGIFDSMGDRNAPALFNLAWQKSFMWDGAINHLDVQALAPITNAKEMAESLVGVIEKLRKKEMYRTAFFAAFNDTVITGEYVLKALSQFQLTLISANAKFDRVALGKEQFTHQEKKGYKLFLKHCNSCHTQPLFSNYQFKNNGLPLDSVLMDFGRGAITQKGSDSMLFKVPSLRNLSFTAPYMHDGRFKKLGDVMAHYNSGILSNNMVSKELKKPLKLNADDRVDLIAFLLTLNDKEFVFDPKHQYPKEILSASKD